MKLKEIWGKRRLILIFFLFLSICCKRSNNNNGISLQKESELLVEDLKTTKGVGVVNVNRLRFRADNDLHSKTLRYLDKGTIVAILNKDYNRVRIGEMEDYWYQIEYNGITGWAFGYFLDIYSSYDKAQIGASKYKKNESSENEDPVKYYDDTINNNLFFLSHGKLLQVKDGRKGIAKKLKAQSGMVVIDYFFTNKPYHMYYLAKNPNNLNGNGYLYYYNIKTERNKLLIKGVYSADISKESNFALIVGKQKEKDLSFWVISSIIIESQSNAKEITKIKQKKYSENLEQDVFTRSMKREMGSLVYLKLDEKGNFIYFRPPEENQTYLISILNGKYIQIESEETDVYYIDSSQYISIYSNENSDGGGLYSIILKDKFSGMEREIIKSNLYPIYFSTSPKKNLLAISMLDVNKSINNYYSSSVYVLSLSTYSLIPISTEGNSYHPKWSNHLLR